MLFVCYELQFLRFVICCWFCFGFVCLFVFVYVCVLFVIVFCLFCCCDCLVVCCVCCLFVLGVFLCSFIFVVCLRVDGLFF